MSATKIQYKLQNLGKALQQLQNVCKKPLDKDNTILDATIHRFEFCYELFWKTLKAILENEGIEATTPRNVLQEAYKTHWITDEKLWLAMIKDRNTTSHVYDEKIALLIYTNIQQYSIEMQTTYKKLVEKFQ